jgi:spermidine synthase
MQPWIHLDTAKVLGGGELKLMQRGAEFSINAGPLALMTSWMSSSEIALADITCERLRGRRKIHFLIGGYGMGFTLRAALAGLPADAKVTVAEIVPQILTWAKGPMATLTANGLTDPRTVIYDGDVVEAIAAGRAQFDAILLDVDNGPDSLTTPGNDRLYSPQGLAVTRRALKPGGLLAIWSSFSSKDFTRRLGHAGFAVEEIESRAHKGKGARHTIWVATNR